LGRAMMNLIGSRQGEWITPAWTSAVFGLVVLVAAVRIFCKRDY
jgi:hypothetical protein